MSVMTLWACGGLGGGIYFWANLETTLRTAATSARVVPMFEAAHLPVVLLAQGALVLVLWLAVRRFAASFSRQLSGLRQACAPTFRPTAPPVHCVSGVHELPLGALEGATHSWGHVSWNTTRLRDGPASASKGRNVSSATAPRPRLLSTL